MKQKHLESALSSIQREFPCPDVTLEQYPTSPHLTASVVLTALRNGDVGPGMTAGDLGCGTGMLSIACALVECDYVIGIDCDQTALKVASDNASDMEVDDCIGFVLARVRGIMGKSKAPSSSGFGGRGGGKKSRRKAVHGRSCAASSPMPTKMTSEMMDVILSDDDGLPLSSDCVDTVLTNPPFGTKNNAGMDVRFLRTATRLAKRAVYSFHKSSTRDFLARKVQDWGMTVEVVAQMKFDIPQTYKFHKEKSVDVEVDLIRVAVSTGTDERNVDNDDKKDDCEEGGDEGDVSA